MSRFRNEQGFALASAIMLLAVIMALGLGLMLFTDNQQKASGREQASETAFNVAEAALDAQVGQISRSWPASEGEKRCEAGNSTSTNGCPSAESMNVAYPASAAKCSTNGGPQDAWRSKGEPTTEWSTYVRDNAVKNEASYFNSATESSQLPYDANGDNKLWVRAVGIAQCRLVAVTALVSRQEVSANFPTLLMSANWFKTGNNGKGHEVIVEGKNPEGGASQNGEVMMRCNGIPTVAECEEYREGQLANAKVNPPPGAPTPTLNATQLAAFRQQAEFEHTYYGPGVCPTGLPSGKPVYVTGPCAVTGVKQEVANSKEKPGFLIIVNGTFELVGQAEFWGTVYCVNKQESSGIVVKIGGNASLKGEIVVDGNGGMEVGENHQRNVEYDPRSAGELKVYAGATPTRNTFRVLSTNE
jgi:Tfp pilus assembly protein PilX